MKHSLLTFCCAVAFAIVSYQAFAARDGSGTMSVPWPSFHTNPGPGHTISSSAVDSNFSTIVSEITNSVPRDGQAPPTANLPMGGFKLTGLVAGTVTGDSVNYEQLQAATASVITASSTNTFTNKTYDTAGTGNVFKINGNSITGISGNSAVVATTTGALANGDCVSIDSNGNFVDSGGACGGGGGGSGIVNSGTAGQLALYATSTNTVSGSANFTTSAGALTLGQAASVQGSLKLSGSTTGTTTLAAPVTGGWTATLPSATDTLVGKATTDTLTNKTFDTAGTGNVFKLNGTTITTASDALKTIGSTQGQVLYYNGTIWTVLGTGTAGQVLTTNGAAANPSWSSPSSAMTLLATVNASGAASVSFNATYITSTYHKYVIEYDNFLFSSGADQLAIRVSTNNCSTFVTSGYADEAVSDPNAHFASGAGNYIALGGADFSTFGPVQGTIKFSYPASGSYTNFESSLSGRYSGAIYGNVTAGVWGSGTVNCIKIYGGASGNNLNGNFHLYGITGS